MNLSDMATLVCDRARQNNDDAITACKRFLNARLKMIWNEALWKDSLWQYNITLSTEPTGDAGNYYLFNAEGHYLFPDFVDRIIALKTADNTMSVEGLDSLFRVSPDIFDQSGGNPTNFHILNPCVWIYTVAQPVICEPVNSVDEDIDVVVTGIDENNRRVTETIALSIKNSPVVGATNWVLVERITKPVTSSEVSVLNGTLDQSIVYFAATDTVAKPKLHIRILPKPTEDTAFKVLIKKRPMELTGDYDEPELRDAENALMAFAEGDLLRRARQRAKADGCYAEGKTLLDQLKLLNAYQEATSTRLTPWTENEPSCTTDDSFLRG